MTDSKSKKVHLKQIEICHRYFLFLLRTFTEIIDHDMYLSPIPEIDTQDPDSSLKVLKLVRLKGSPSDAVKDHVEV